jgi:hypothetical protein
LTTSARSLAELTVRPAAARRRIFVPDTWLPKSAYVAEAKPLAALVRPKRRGPQRIGDLIVPLLIRLGLFPRLRS